MDPVIINTIGTAVVVPLVLALVKLGLPKIPTWLIPVLAPLLGVLAGYLATVTMAHQSNVLLSAFLGLAGVGVREVIDQLKPASTK